MALHTVIKGLDLPIAGDPAQKIEDCTGPRKVALTAADYVGMKPAMQVRVGDTVKRGQVLFEDKKTPGVLYTAPGAGTIVALNRGARRAFQSFVVELTETERNGEPADGDFQPFESYTGKAPADTVAEEVKALLLESGMWTALRGRPFGRVAIPEVVPNSIFVTAMDTNPLAASVQEVLKGNEDAFQNGLELVSKLTGGKTFVCKAPGTTLPAATNPKIQIEDFEGPHPSGLAGLHIETLDPVHRDKTVWYLNYQDVVSIGNLFATGRLDVGRVVSLAGPTAKNPRLLRTRVGASLDDLVQGELQDGENRVVSGSVLSGRAAMGEVHGYLGRYHTQVTVLAEGNQSEFIGWMLPGANKFSTIGAYLSSLLPKKKYAFNTNTNGSPRAMVPIGMYERVMPMDIMPTFLLRSLIVGDVEKAEKLGCLELEEEDLALCTFVCPGKIDYGSILRKNLTEIEKEG